MLTKLLKALRNLVFHTIKIQYVVVITIVTTFLLGLTTYKIFEGKENQPVVIEGIQDLAEAINDLGELIKLEVERARRDLSNNTN